MNVIVVTTMEFRRFKLLVSEVLAKTDSVMDFGTPETKIIAEPHVGAE